MSDWIKVEHKAPTLSLNAQRVKELQTQGMSASQVCKQMGIGREEYEGCRQEIKTEEVTRMRAEGKTRNDIIYERYRAGATYKALAYEYCLTTARIGQIVGQKAKDAQRQLPRAKAVEAQPEPTHDAVERPEPTHDAVERPEHYTYGKYECIDEMVELFGLEAVKAFCRCNIYKYRYRAGHKNGAEDIAKAEQYMTILKRLEGKEE